MLLDCLTASLEVCSSSLVHGDKNELGMLSQTLLFHLVAGESLSFGSTVTTAVPSASGGLALVSMGILQMHKEQSTETLILSGMLIVAP